MKKISGKKNLEVKIVTKADRREKEREIRRKDIINAAENLFFSNDYEHVTMNDIAEEVEMARGTLYQYFKNKEDIYATIAIRASKMIQEMFQELLSKDQIGIDKIRSICEFYYEFYKKNPGYYNAYYHSGVFETQSTPTLEKLKKITKTSFKIAVNTVKQGIKDGSIRENLDPVVTTLFMLATANNVNNITPVTQMYINEYGLTHETLFQQSLDMAIKSIQNKAN